MSSSQHQAESESHKELLSTLHAVSEDWNALLDADPQWISGMLAKLKRANAEQNGQPIDSKSTPSKIAPSNSRSQMKASSSSVHTPSSSSKSNIRSPPSTSSTPRRTGPATPTTTTTPSVSNTQALIHTLPPGVKKELRIKEETIHNMDLKMSGLTDRLRSSSKTIMDLKEEKNVRDDELRRCKARIVQLEQIVIQLKGDRDRMQDDNAILSEQNSEYHSLNSKLMDTLNEQQLSKSKEYEQNRVREEDLQDLVKRNTDLLQQNRTLKEELEDRQSDMDKLSDQVVELTKRNASLMTLYRKEESLKLEFQEEKRVLLEEVTGYRDRFHEIEKLEARGDVVRLRDLVSKKEEKIRKLGSRVKEAEDRAKASEKAKVKALEDLASMEERLRVLRKRNSQLMNKKDTGPRPEMVFAEKLKALLGLYGVWHPDEDEWSTDMECVYRLHFVKAQRELEMDPMRPQSTGLEIRRRALNESDVRPKVTATQSSPRARPWSPSRKNPNDRDVSPLQSNRIANPLIAQAKSSPRRGMSPTDSALEQRASLPSPPNSIRYVNNAFRGGEIQIPAMIGAPKKAKSPDPPPPRPSDGVPPRLPLDEDVLERNVDRSRELLSGRSPDSVLSAALVKTGLATEESVMEAARQMREEMAMEELNRSTGPTERRSSPTSNVLTEIDKFLRGNKIASGGSPKTNTSRTDVSVDNDNTANNLLLKEIIDLHKQVNESEADKERAQLEAEVLKAKMESDLLNGSGHEQKEPEENKASSNDQV